MLIIIKQHRYFSVTKKIFYLINIRRRTCKKAKRFLTDVFTPVGWMDGLKESHALNLCDLFHFTEVNPKIIKISLEDNVKYFTEF